MKYKIQQSGYQHTKRNVFSNLIGVSLGLETASDGRKTSEELSKLELITASKFAKSVQLHHNMEQAIKNFSQILVNDTHSLNQTIIGMTTLANVLAESNRLLTTAQAVNLELSSLEQDVHLLFTTDADITVNSTDFLLIYSSPNITSQTYRVKIHTIPFSLDKGQFQYKLPSEFYFDVSQGLNNAIVLDSGNCHATKNHECACSNTKFQSETLF